MTIERGLSRAYRVRPVGGREVTSHGLPRLFYGQYAERAAAKYCREFAAADGTPVVVLVKDYLAAAGPWYSFSATGTDPDEWVVVPTDPPSRR